MIDRLTLLMLKSFTPLDESGGLSRCRGFTGKTDEVLLDV